MDTSATSGPPRRLGAVSRRKVVENGRVLQSVHGRVFAVAPPFEPDIERAIGDYFDRYHLITPTNFCLSADQLAQTFGSELIVQ